MSQNETEPRVPTFIPVVAGGVSGVLTRLICQPLDVIKIRFQLQVEPISKESVESKYRSIPQALRLIVKEEGLLALWKGHVPAQALSLTYGVFQFGVYEAMVNEAKRFPLISEDKVKVEFVCGFTAGCAATVLSFPFDIVRTRLIAQGNQKVYSSTINGLMHILDVEGLKGWWKGLTPTLVQIGPLSGVQFAVFNFFKRLFQDVEWLSDSRQDRIGSLTISGTMIAGSLAGFSAKVATYPMDLTRKRMQLQGFESARVGFGKNFTCTSLKNCIVETIREERVFGLFKGFCPSLIKASAVNALIFTFYEKTYSLLCDMYKTAK